MNYWHNKFISVFNFIKDKLFGKKEERETYMDMAYELNRKKIIDDLNDTYQLNVDYDKNKEIDDDFEI